MNNFGGNAFAFLPYFVLLHFYFLLNKILRILLVGLSGLEPPTSRLSGVRSNRLSYRPMQGYCSDSSTT